MHLLAKVPSKALRPLHTPERAGPQAPHILSLFSGACHTRERLEGPWIRMGGGAGAQSPPFSELAAICGSGRLRVAVATLA